MEVGLVLLLHRGEETIAAQVEGQGHCLVDQRLAEHALAAVDRFHTEPPAIPQARCLLVDAHGPHHPVGVTTAVSNRDNRNGPKIALVAILGEQTLLSSEH
ncbi:hypothetical protein FQZ97_1204900 [compost metagenome]